MYLEELTIAITIFFWYPLMNKQELKHKDIHSEKKLCLQLDEQYIVQKKERSPFNVSVLYFIIAKLYKSFIWKQLTLLHAFEKGKWSWDRIYLDWKLSFSLIESFLGHFSLDRKGG